MKHILIADEMDLVTQGASLALVGEKELQVVAEVHTLPEVLNVLIAGGIDIIVASDGLDYRYSHFRLLEQLLMAAPKARTVLMGQLMDGHLLHDLLQSGLRAYLHRADPLRECLPAAVRAVANGTNYLSPTASAGYLTAMQAESKHAKLDHEAYVILQMLAQGSTAGQIAHELGIPIRRVYTQFEKLRRRFNAATNAQMMSRAAAEGYATLMR